MRKHEKVLSARTAEQAYNPEKYQTIDMSSPLHWISSGVHCDHLSNDCTHHIKLEVTNF